MTKELTTLPATDPRWQAITNLNQYLSENGIGTVHSLVLRKTYQDTAFRIILWADEESISALGDPTYTKRYPNAWVGQTIITCHHPTKPGQYRKTQWTWQGRKYHKAPYCQEHYTQTKYSKLHYKAERNPAAIKGLEKIAQRFQEELSKLPAQPEDQTSYIAREVYQHTLQDYIIQKETQA